MLALILRLKPYYFKGLPIILTFTSVTSLNDGFITEANRQNKIPLLHQISNITSKLSIGIITGLTYPISIPLFGYILYKYK